MRVVVVEDQLLFQEFLVNLLRDRLGHEVVGVAQDGKTALELVRTQRPDLLVLDILIPQLSGIRVAKVVQEEQCAKRILAISSETDLKTVHQIHQLRLSGFVDKNEATLEVLMEAIETIRQGNRYFSPSLQLTVQKLRADPHAFQKILTRREQEILTLIGGGLSDAEIGQRLGLSPTSIQSHRSNLFRKLDVHSTPELIRFAQESGFYKVGFRKMQLLDTYHIHD